MASLDQDGFSGLKLSHYRRAPFLYFPTNSLARCSAG